MSKKQLDKLRGEVVDAINNKTDSPDLVDLKSASFPTVIQEILENKRENGQSIVDKLADAYQQELNIRRSEVYTDYRTLYSKVHSAEDYNAEKELDSLGANVTTEEFDDENIVDDEDTACKKEEVTAAYGKKVKHVLIPVTVVCDDHASLNYKLVVPPFFESKRAEGSKYSKVLVLDVSTVDARNEMPVYMGIQALTGKVPVEGASKSTHVMQALPFGITTQKHQDVASDIVIAVDALAPQQVRPRTVKTIDVISSNASSTLLKLTESTDVPPYVVKLNHYIQETLQKDISHKRLEMLSNRDDEFFYHNWVILHDAANHPIRNALLELQKEGTKLVPHLTQGKVTLDVLMPLTTLATALECVNAYENKRYVLAKSADLIFAIWRMDNKEPIKNINPSYRHRSASHDELMPYTLNATMLVTYIAQPHFLQIKQSTKWSFDVISNPTGEGEGEEEGEESEEGEVELFNKV
jgi:hypothetical protein